MIKSLKRRFIAAAMLSVVVVLVLLLAAVAAVGFFAMEKASDQTLEMLSRTQFMPDAEQSRPADGQPEKASGADAQTSATPLAIPEEADQAQPGDIGAALPGDGGEGNLPGWLFGYQLKADSGALNYFTVACTADGTVTAVDASRAPSVGEEDAQAYCARALQNGESGKLDSFKYRVNAQPDGSRRLVFLDVTLQIRTLTDTIGAAALVFLGCIAVMPLVVLLIAGRAVRPIAENIERQRRFVTDAGHEIKTPLAVIMANTDALELHEGESRWSGNIRASAVRLSELMKRLLSLSRMDEGRSVYPMAELDLSAVVRSVIDAFGESAEQKGVTIEAHIAEGLRLYGNRDSLTELATVLVDNAVKYVDDGGAVSCRLAQSGRRVVLETVNTCAALPDAPPERLFERFFRGDASRSHKDGGFGVGLSAAKAAVELHAGRLNAFYDDAHTIRFRAELPVNAARRERNGKEKK